MTMKATFIREARNAQILVYHISKVIVPAETRCPNIEKLSFALVISSRKLIPYFQAHSIVIPTSYPLIQVIEEPELSWRLSMCKIELGNSRYHVSPALDKSLGNS